MEDYISEDIRRTNRTIHDLPRTNKRLLQETVQTPVMSPAKMTVCVAVLACLFAVNYAQSINCTLADGSQVASGEQFAVDCNTCICLNGSVGCSNLVCDTSCNVTGTIIQDGSVFVSSSDGCSVCSCSQSVVTCNSDACAAGTASASVSVPTEVAAASAAAAAGGDSSSSDSSSDSDSR